MVVGYECGNTYLYDKLGQVTNGVHARSTGEAFFGQSIGYRYDDIGNRKLATRGAAAENYTANLLNQYSSRTVPGIFDILGEADATTAITVNGKPAQRQANYWRGTVTVDNASAPVYAAIVVTGMTASVTNRQAGTRFVPKTPETFGYDADGNLTNDGRFAYFWDAENRLISIQTDTSKVGTAVPAVRLDFAYDSQSRRFRKTVYTRTSDLWSLTSDLFFIYDGWNLIREERRPDAKGRALNYAYTWGLDLSGSQQGAGGIGGLLAASYGNTAAVSSVFYAFDGNGNVTDLIGTNGTRLAHYEYDPFGNTLVATGPMARDNTLRFSSKGTDDETGLVYYGLRFLSTGLGRWVNRDPLEEKGGINTYVAGLNSLVNMVDRLGLAPASMPPSISMPIDQLLFGGTVKLDDSLVVNGSVEGEVVVRTETFMPMSPGIGITAKRKCPGSQIGSFSNCKWIQFIRAHFYDNYGNNVPSALNLAFSAPPMMQVTGMLYLDAPLNPPWYSNADSQNDYTCMFDMPGVGFPPGTVTYVAHFTTRLACKLNSGNLRAVYQIDWVMKQTVNSGRSYSNVYGQNIAALPSWAGPQLLLGYNPATGAPNYASNPL